MRSIGNYLLSLMIGLLLAGGLASSQALAEWYPGGSPDHPFDDPIGACQYSFQQIYGWDYSYDGVTFLSRNPALGPTYAACHWSKNFDNPFFPPLLGSDATLECPAGTVPAGYSPNGCAPPPQNGLQCKRFEGDPINVVSGNLFEAADDFHTAGSHSLQLTRYYNSQWVDASRLGAGWRTTFDRQFSGNGSYVRIVLADGREALFQKGAGWQAAYLDSSGNVQVPRTDVQWTLVQNASSWTFTDEDGTVENYSASGQLTSIVYRGGYTQTLAYDANGNNTGVTDSFGRSIGFGYNNAGLLSTVTTPGGDTIQYQYQYVGPALPTGAAPGIYGPTTRMILTAVTYPAIPPAVNPVISYQYEDGTYVTALTGETDARGVRYTTWTYDGNGRATSSQHAGGVELTTIQYDDVGGTRTVTNALGKQAIYHLTPGPAALQKVASIEGQASPHCTAGITQFGYDANGFTNQSTDAEGRVTSFVNDSLGRALSTTEGSGTPIARTTTRSWLTNYPLPTQIVKPGLTTNLSYDSAGRILQRQLVDTMTQTIPYSTGGQTRTWTYSYNAAGLLASVDGPLDGTADTTSYAYDSHGYLATVTNALGQVTHITSVNSRGQPLSSVDANGVETDFAYDAQGRVTQITVNPGAAAFVTTIGYDGVGDVTSVAKSNGEVYSYGYDNARQLVSVIDASGAQVQYTRNAMGGITATTVSDSVGTVVRSAGATFDELNRQLSSIGATGQTSGYGYDRTGNQTTYTDPLNNQYGYAFDALNRLIGESGPLGYSVSYGYDAGDRLTSVTDPRGFTTTYVYNGFGDLISQTSPDSGTTIKTYDAAGHLRTSTDGNGLTTVYQYDLLGRVTTITRADGSNLRYYWDQNDASHGAGIGRQTHAVDESSGVSLDWKYDALGRVVAKTESMNGSAFTTSYQYGGDGNVQSMTLPSGAVIGYAWSSGRIAGLTFNNAALVSNIAYDASGGPKSWTLGNQEIAGRSYDLDGRVSADPVEGISYDTASRVSDLALGGHSVISGGQSFGYDALNRLIGYSDDNNTLAYSYDANGNRTRQTLNLVQTDYTIAPGSNRLLSASTGQVLTALNPATYGYDPQGTRAWRADSTDTRYFVYDDGKRLVGEYLSSGSPVQETVYLDDMPIAVIKNGVAYFIHADYRNTPRQIDNAAGQAVWTWNPLPFGDTDENADPLGLSTAFSYALRYPGQYYDGDSQTFNNVARYFDPAVGRYLESDPIGLRGGLNTYAYVGNDPINYVDPDGREKTRPVSPGGPCIFDCQMPPVLPGTVPWQPGGPLTGNEGIDDCLYAPVSCASDLGSSISGAVYDALHKDCPDDYCKRNAQRLIAERNFLLDASAIAKSMGDEETIITVNNDIIAFNREVEDHNKLCRNLMVLPLRTI